MNMEKGLRPEMLSEEISKARELAKKIEAMNNVGWARMIEMTDFFNSNPTSDKKDKFIQEADRLGLQIGHDCQWVRKKLG